MLYPSENFSEKNVTTFYGERKGVFCGKFRFFKRISIVVMGAGFRGGNWNNDATNARTSDRNNAANTNSSRNNNYGGRCVNTSPFIADRGQKTEVRTEKFAVCLLSSAKKVL